MMETDPMQRWLRRRPACTAVLSHAGAALGRSVCVLLLSLLALPVAHAAIAVDNAAHGVTAGGNVASLTWTHTVNAGSNRILVVGISLRTGNVSIGTVTFAGTALTKIGAINSGGNQNRSELWYLLAPTPTTNGAIVATIAGGQTGAMVGGSISFTGVNQSTPLGTFATGTSNGSTTASVTVSSGAGQVVVDTATSNGDGLTLTAGGSQAQQWSAHSGSGSGGESLGGGSTQPGAASTTMTWTVGASKPWSIIAVPLLAATVPAFVNLKTVQVTSDPVDGTTNPKYIPGAYALYTIQVTNTGNGSPDNNSVFVYDAVPANTTLYVGDLSGAGTGPIQFAQGSPTSSLTYTYTSLASTTDNVDFSNNGGTTYTYTPVPDGSGFDANVTNIRVSPQGVFAAAGGGNPYFTVSFRVRVN